MNQTSYEINDGPLIRWAMKHAHKHFTESHHPRNFSNDLGIFREKRDSTGSFSTLEWPISIDGISCCFQMSGNSDVFELRLSIKDTRIHETHVKPNRGRNGHNIFNVSAGIVLPVSVIGSLIGQPIDRLIQLQPSLHEIISGRTMTKIRQHETAIMLTLSSDHPKRS